MSDLLQVDFDGDWSAEDDIDKLFSRLAQLEPPANVVTRVMTAVARLPLPQFISPSTEEMRNNCENTGW